MKQNLINSNSGTMVSERKRETDHCHHGHKNRSHITMAQGSNTIVVKIRLFKLTNLATSRARDGPQNSRLGCLQSLYPKPVCLRNEIGNISLGCV